MKIYVKSRGYEQSQDYRWLTNQEQNLIQENPSTFQKLKPDQIIYPEATSISLILARQDKELHLLVTGLETKERHIFSSNRIRNSIALIIHDSDNNERIIRSLAILALRGKLETEVDRAVQTITPSYGFEVDWEKINEIPNLLKVKDAKNIDSDNKVGNNSEELRKKLALELEENPLPKRDGLLVVVTSLKKEDYLSEKIVWRGLSNQVSYPDWRKVEKKNQKDLGISVIVTVIVILLLIVIFKILTQPNVEQKPKPLTSPSPPPVTPQITLPTEESPLPTSLLEKELILPTSLEEDSILTKHF